MKYKNIICQDTDNCHMRHTYTNVYFFLPGSNNDIIMKYKLTKVCLTEIMHQSFVCVWLVAWKTHVIVYNTKGTFNVILSHDKYRNAIQYSMLFQYFTISHCIDGNNALETTWHASECIPQPSHHDPNSNQSNPDLDWWLIDYSVYT